MSDLTIKEQIFPVCDYSNVYGPYVNHLFDMSTRRTIWRDGIEYYTAAVKVGVNIAPLISVFTNTLVVDIEDYELQVNRLVFVVDGVKRIGTVVSLDANLRVVWNEENDGFVTIGRNSTCFSGVVKYRDADGWSFFPISLSYEKGAFVLHERPGNDGNVFVFEPIAIDFTLYKDRG